MNDGSAHVRELRRKGAEGKRLRVGVGECRFQLALDVRGGRAAHHAGQPRRAVVKGGAG